jgi:hypothetical protein
MHHYVFCIAEEDETFAEETIKLLINHVWKLHELSNTIISNRDFQFVSLVWKTVCEALKIDVKLSTAFHFETDDQSEIVNQEMKRYLRSYCNYQQNDWSEWLFMTEFAFNAAIFVFTELFAFMINYEFESRMSFDLVSTEESIKERIFNKKTFDIIEKMKNIWEFIRKKLINTQKAQKRYADQKRTSTSEYKLENVMWLFTKTLKSKDHLEN